MARIIRTAPLIPATGFEPADVRLGSEGEVRERPEADKNAGPFAQAHKRRILMTGVPWSTWRLRPQPPRA